MVWGRCGAGPREEVEPRNGGGEARRCQSGQRPNLSAWVCLDPASAQPTSPSGVRRRRPPRSCQVPRCPEWALGAQSTSRLERRGTDARGRPWLALRPANSPSRSFQAQVFTGFPGHARHCRDVSPALWTQTRGSLAGGRAWGSEAWGTVLERLSVGKVLSHICYLDPEPSSLACSPETGPESPSPGRRLEHGKRRSTSFLEAGVQVHGPVAAYPDAPLGMARGEGRGAGGGLQGRGESGRASQLWALRGSGVCATRP